MNYYTPKTEMVNPLIMKRGDIFSSRQLAQVFGFTNSNAFTKSACCKHEFIKVKVEEIKGDKDGYSKHGRHIPENFTTKDISDLQRELQPLIKKFKLTSLCLVANRHGKRPATIIIK